MWKIVDVRVIDGAVNGVAESVRGWSELLRRLQTGSVRAYAVSLFLGVVRCSGTTCGGKDSETMHFPILTSLVALPIVGSLVLFFVSDDEHNEGAIRRIALIVAGLVFAETLLLWARFDPVSADFQFVERHAWIPSFGISYAVGVDGISLLLLVLTGFLTPIALLSSWESVHKKTRAFCIAILLLESAMMGVFVSLDLFLFYVFWDAMLIPMYFLIGIWGYDRRIYAAVKFILYTMAGSVLMLLAILALAVLHAVDDRQLQLRSADALRPLDSGEPAVLVLPRLCARVRDQGAAVSVPHLAARRARRGADRGLGDSGRRAAEDGHLRSGAIRVSAVSDGRRVLRALPGLPRRRRHHLRRAGRHGAARHEEAGRLFERQPSRVSSCSASPRMNTQGVQGAVYQMLSHGVSTGGLFLIVGMLSDRRHTRLISEFGGLKKVMPRLVAAFLLITLSSIGLPGLNGFVGEFLILLGAFTWNPRLAAFAATGVILSATYMLWMFQRVNYGSGRREKRSAAGSEAAGVGAGRADRRGDRCSWACCRTSFCGRWGRRSSGCSIRRGAARGSRCARSR